jgi:YbbR domain-containing protein
MTAAVRFVLRNWPLKLAAVLLASLLYAGLVLSQSTATFAESVPIVVQGESADVSLLTNPGDVDLIRYIAPPTVRVDSSRFEATIDLTGLEPRDRPISVPVEVRAVDPRITVLSVEPARIDVVLARIMAKSVRVSVQPGVVPPGLQIGDRLSDPATVEVRGPEPDLARVVAVEARVQIEPSGLDFNRDTELIPVDSLGEEVLGVTVTPVTARVTVDVFTDSDSRTLSINPTLTGTPATDYEIASVVVAPLVATVSGDAQTLAAMAAVDTAPIQVAGRRESLQTNVSLELPSGVTSLTREVQVTITLRRVVDTRTLSAGIVLAGVQPGHNYSLSADRVLVTLSGSPGSLNGLATEPFLVRADVAAFGEGVHEVALTPTLPEGVTLVSVNPATILVTVAVPAAPGVSGGPSAAP